MVEEFDLTHADALRLRSEGFISSTTQRTRGPRTAGVTRVDLFPAAEGAEDSMAHELRTDVIRRFVASIRRFTVPDVPGARGFTALKPDFAPSDPHGNIGHVLWVQGRCMFLLGNQSPGPLVGPLSRGARAIYQRTNAQCP